MSCGEKLVRYSFITYVLFLGVLSVVTIIFAAWLLIELLGYAYFLSPSLASGPLIAILVGGVVLLPLTVVFGFRVFSQKKQGLAIVFWVWVCVASILCVALGVWSMILKFRLHDRLEVEMHNMTPPEKRNDFEKQQWDYVQRTLMCCGTKSISDYTMQKAIPMSCCEVLGGVCARTYEGGCLIALSEFGGTKLIEAAIAAAIIAIVLFLGVYAGCSFSSWLKRSASTANKISPEAQENGQETLPLRISQNPKIFLKDQYDD